MRKIEERRSVLELNEQGLNNCQIVRVTGIPRGTVRCIIKRYNGAVSELAQEDLKSSEANPSCVFDSHQRHHYSYLLGMYLGDGCISDGTRCQKIRVSLDIKYPMVIDKVKESLSVVFPYNKVGTWKVTKANCIVVFLYSKKLSSYFPQHAPGRKHDRKISLKKWQRKIVDEYPQQFLLGFLHSDGCRFTYKQGNRVYSRYEFSNKSNDIIRLFIMVCKKLKIHFKCQQKSGTTDKNGLGVKNVSINKQEYISIIDAMGGCKFFLDKQK